MRRVNLFMLLICLLFNFSLIIPGTAMAAPKAGKNSKKPEEGQPAVILVLSGGGVKGYAHIGVLEVLEENNIPIAGIVGTSMGAIIGGLSASGYSPKELRAIVNDLNFNKIISATGQNSAVSANRGDLASTLIKPEIFTDSKGNVKGPLGLFSGVGVMDLIIDLTGRVTVVDFNELPTPFAAVATDLMTGEKVVLRRGSLSSAIRASMSFPGVFDPWELDGRQLVDGGLVSNLPVITAMELFPGYPIVAVNLSSSPRRSADVTSYFDVIDQTINILTSQNVDIEAQLADILLEPDVRSVPVFAGVEVDSVIQRGRDVATEALPQIKEILKVTPATYVKRQSPKPMVVRDVLIEGMPEEVQEEFKDRYSDWIGKTVDTKEILNVARLLVDRHDVRAVDYDLIEEEGEVTVKFKVVRYPSRMFALGGYANTLDGSGWLAIEGAGYDFFRGGDSLIWKLYLADNWGLKMNYLWNQDYNPWELELGISSYGVDPRNQPGTDWLRYAFSVKRHLYDANNAYINLGLQNMWFNYDGHNSKYYFAPQLTMAFNNLNDSQEPTRGISATLNALYPFDLNDLVLRFEFKTYMLLSQKTNSRLEIAGGYTRGSHDDFAWGAYLGGRNELYSLANNPIWAKDFAWWRATYIHPFRGGMFGSMNFEFFVGQGYAWDIFDYDDSNPLEAGIAFSSSKTFLNARVFAVYSDVERWKFGITLGLPDWNVYQAF